MGTNVGDISGQPIHLRRASAPAEWAVQALQTAGARWAGPIAIIRNWTYCIFYVMAELWGSVVVSVLFWGCANQVGALAGGAAALTGLCWSPGLRVAAQPSRRREFLPGGQVGCAFPG